MRKLVHFSIFLLLVGCHNFFPEKEGLEFESVQVQPVFANNEINFKNITDKVITPHCLSCHPNYSQYSSVVSEKKKILNSIKMGRMPKDATRLEQDLVDLVEAWIEAGAPFDSQGEEPKPIPLAATWESVSQNIIFPKCVRCHNPDGQASFLSLNTHKDFKDNADYLFNNFDDIDSSYFMEVITDPDEPMPPVWSGIQRLSDEEVKVIREWIKLKLPE